MANRIADPALDPGRLFGGLLAAGFRDFAGVPCSILSPLFRAASITPGVRYVPAVVEGEAVAIAAGVWLGGGSGAVLLQNSGLGNTVNPLASLLLPYGIPVVFIVSWRGEPGRDDAAHHLPMGAATIPLLKMFDVDTHVLRTGADLEHGLVAAGQRQRGPTALVVPRGVFHDDGEALPLHADPPGPRPTERQRFTGGRLPDRAKAVRALLDVSGSDRIVASTGFASRELASAGPAPHHFYMQGSMGFAAAIGLGVARTTGQRTWVLDGDGALLMRMGTLATIGAMAPDPFVHLVLDNGTYASTGGQPTVSPGVDFSAVALACGYRAAGYCDSAQDLPEAMAWATSVPGPVLLHIRISPVEPKTADRPTLPPAEIAAAFRALAPARKPA